MSEYKIDEQEWKSWPKAVMMRRDWTTNGHDHRKEVRRYVPDDESETLRREVNRLRSTIKCLESRLRNSYRSDRRLDKWAERLRGRIHDIARDRDKLTAENDKLRELVYNMLVDEKRGHNDDSKFDEHVERAKELGVEI